MADQDTTDRTSFGEAAPKRERGFAAMDPELQRSIASKGGRAAHEKGTAHEFTSDEARIAGRKGGEASRSKLNGRRVGGSGTPGYSA